jgi:GDP-6-deoxy-D-talose 4-dehydrogenase
LVSRSERVLLTGIAGFTGRHLATRLRQDGHEVIGVGKHGTGEEQLDLCDRDALTALIANVRPSAVIHLAGISEPTHGDIAEIYSGNVIATANIFAALLTCNLAPNLIIIASSATVYAPAHGDSPVKEDHALAPKSHYAISKRAIEDIAALYSDRFPILVTRPFNYTGSGQSTNFLVPKIVQHFAEKRRQIRLGNLDVYRDISDVSRVVEAYARLLSGSVARTTVNLCSGRMVHFAQIIPIMRQISGLDIEVVTDPALVRTNEVRAICGSPEHLERLVGTLPNPEFCETLRVMYEKAVEA